MGTAFTRYVPSDPVVDSRVMPVAVLVTVTFAPGITAPCGSVIVPTSLPVASCAASGKYRTKIKVSKVAIFKRKEFGRLIWYSFLVVSVTGGTILLGYAN